MARATSVGPARRVAPGEWPGLGETLFLLILLEFEAILFLRAYAFSRPPPSDDVFLGWTLVWLAAAIGMTLNRLWGVAYYAFVKHDYRSQRWPFNVIDIVHAGFVTVFIMGLGSLVLTASLLPAEGHSLIRPITLTIAALLGYFNQQTFKVLYDRFLKLLKQEPGLMVDPDKTLEGTDFRLRGWTARSLDLAPALSPNVTAQDLDDAVAYLEGRSIRYSLQLVAALPDDADVDGLEVDAPSIAPKEDASIRQGRVKTALKRLVVLSRLAAMTACLETAIEMLRDGVLTQTEGLAWLNGRYVKHSGKGGEEDLRITQAYEHALRVLGLPTDGIEAAVQKQLAKVAQRGRQQTQDEAAAGSPSPQRDESGMSV